MWHLRKKKNTCPSLYVLGFVQGRTLPDSPARRSRTSQTFYDLLLLLAFDCITAAATCSSALVAFKLCCRFHHRAESGEAENSTVGSSRQATTSDAQSTPLFLPGGRAQCEVSSWLCCSLLGTGRGTSGHAKCQECFYPFCWNLVLVLCWLGFK